MTQRVPWLFPFIPHPPAQVRDAFAVAQYRSLIGQVPIAYATVIPVFLAWMMMPALHAPLWLGRCILLGFTAVSCLRLLVWLARKNDNIDPRRAERAMLGSSAISTMLAGMCGLWASFSWLHASAAFAPYFPLILTVGLLTPVIAQSYCPRAAIMNLGAGLTPLIVTMMVYGDGPARVAAMLPLVMAVFLINMLCQQRRRFIDLLVLEARMREEAKTDPLTGLVNSRALADRFSELVEAARARPDADRHPALLRIDLDGFKPLNEQFGHAAGDDVLRQVADRLRGAVGKGAMVCRLGGDDFALLAALSDGRAVEAMHKTVIAAFDQPFSINGQPVTISTCIAAALWPQDGRTLSELSDTANRRLAVIKQRQKLDQTYATQAAAATKRAAARRKPLQAVRNA